MFTYSKSNATNYIVISTRDPYYEEMRRIRQDMERLTAEALAARQRIGELRRRHARPLRKAPEQRSYVDFNTAVLLPRRVSPPSRFAFYQGDF